MPESPWLDRFPMWTIALTLFALLAIATIIGVEVRVPARKRPVGGGAPVTAHAEVGAVPSISTIVGATLALFGFMLAFTFGEAAGRYETRRLLVIKDANAIGTTYLRAEMLPASEAREARRLLRDYVGLRASAREHGADLDALMMRTDALQQALWAQAKTAVVHAPTPITSLFVQSLNELIDVHGERAAVALVNRVPSLIWVALLVLGLLSMLLTGYERGLGGRGPRAEVLVLAFAFSMILTLNIAIDRPTDGLGVSQAAMENLRRSMTQ